MCQKKVYKLKEQLPQKNNLEEQQHKRRKYIIQ
jgi:hypothetical protein